MIEHFDLSSFGFVFPSVMIWVVLSKDCFEVSLKFTAIESSSLIFLNGVEVGTDVSNFRLGDHIRPKGDDKKRHPKIQILKLERYLSQVLKYIVN